MMTQDGPKPMRLPDDSCRPAVLLNTARSFSSSGWFAGSDCSSLAISRSPRSLGRTMFDVTQLAQSRIQEGALVTSKSSEMIIVEVFVDIGSVPLRRSALYHSAE